MTWKIKYTHAYKLCKLSGKAQEACSALSTEDSLNEDCLETAILNVYELVSGAYQQQSKLQPGRF